MFFPSIHPGVEGALRKNKEERKGQKQSSHHEKEIREYCTLRYAIRHFLTIQRDTRIPDPYRTRERVEFELRVSE